MSQLAVRLEQILPRENFSSDFLERVAYSHDLAVLPRWLEGLYQQLPDLVVRPATVEQVAQSLAWVQAERIPVVPRGRGTSALGGAVPVRGGLMLDISSLDDILRVDGQEESAWVQGGATWQQVAAAAKREGLALRVEPTSSPAATVGGWIANAGLGLGRGGVGIGSPKYGPIGENVFGLQVVLPGGRVLEIPGKHLYRNEDFVGSDGILGVITAARLRLRRRPAAFAALSFQVPEGQALVEGMMLTSLVPETLFAFFEDTQLNSFKQAAGLFCPADGNVVTVALDGDAGPVKDAVERLQADWRSVGANYLGEDPSRRAWEERYYPLRAKRAGPSLLAAEFAVPTVRLGGVLSACRSLGRRMHCRLGVHGTLARGECLVMPYILADEQATWDYLLASGVVGALYDLAGHFGGKPYGVGLFNSFYAPQVHGSGLARLQALKRELDPQRVMNPGKVLQHGTRYGWALPKTAYRLASGLFCALR